MLMVRFTPPCGSFAALVAVGLFAGSAGAQSSPMEEKCQSENVAATDAFDARDRRCADRDRPSDWATFQGNSLHNGFVDVVLDPGRFVPKWTWTVPADDAFPYDAINAVATGEHKVFVSKDVYAQDGTFYALDEKDGSLIWKYEVGRVTWEGAPAYHRGRVFFPANTSYPDCLVFGFEASNGAMDISPNTGCDWSRLMAPTLSDDSILEIVYGVLWDYSTISGRLNWQTNRSYLGWDVATPAVDHRYAYQYGYYGSYDSNTAALFVFDRSTGTLVRQIADPVAPQNTSYSNYSAPAVGEFGDVLSLSGLGFYGGVLNDGEQFESRNLVSYDAASGTVNWHSEHAYLTHPAIARGVVYAGRNSPTVLDALSEADGQVLWSWLPPSGSSSLHRNVIATKNLVFVSTDTAVFAIDLKTHRAVWEYDQPGMLAISKDKVLYIATGATLSDGGLVAIDLDHGECSHDHRGDCD